MRHLTCGHTTPPFMTLHIDVLAESNFFVNFTSYAFEIYLPHDTTKSCPNSRTDFTHPLFAHMTIYCDFFGLTFACGSIFNATKAVSGIFSILFSLLWHIFPDYLRQLLQSSQIQIVLSIFTLTSSLREAADSASTTSHAAAAQEKANISGEKHYISKEGKPKRGGQFSMRPTGELKRGQHIIGN